MTYSELIEEIAKEVTIPKLLARQVIECLKETVVKTTSKGERVMIHSFGTFLPKDIKPRMTFGKMSEGRRTIRFKPYRRTDGEAGSGDRPGEGEGSAGGQRKALP